MSYKLEKNYTDAQRADFIVEYNYNQGFLIEETDSAIYALEPDEMMLDGVPVKNPDYDKTKRLSEIENAFIEIENEYAKYLNSDIEYTNGKTYKIRYASESYQPLIAAETSLIVAQQGVTLSNDESRLSTFPIKIWDSTQLEENAVEMTLTELMQLALFLTNLQQTAWNKRKANIAALETEKKEIVESMNIVSGTGESIE